MKDSSTGRLLLTYILLVFALSIPIWVIGGLTGIQLLPGLPLGALMTVCPVMAALILVFRERGLAGVSDLLKRAFDFQRIKAKAWCIPVVLLMPVVMLLTYWVMRLLGLPLPNPEISLVTGLTLLPIFFVAALGEELGWSGYLIDPMQERWGALRAAILLGVIWAGWHIVPLAQAQRSLGWIAAQCLFLIAARVIFVWLYNNTGKSVFAVAVLHAMVNVSWQLFPNNGSHYDPRIAALIMVVITVVVVLVWQPRTLTRYRYAG
jgi:hypothetical protein